MNQENELSEKIEEVRKEICELRDQLNNQEFRIRGLEQTPSREAITLSPPEPPDISGPLNPPEPPLPPSHEEIPTEMASNPVNIEAMMGGNWLVRAGIAAIVIGIGFFLKYAIDMWGIGPTGRVIGGLAIGIILIGLGEYLKDRYQKYSQALTGGGIAILYLSIFAAFNLYQLINAIPTFFFMAVTTLAAGVLAVRYNAPSIAFIGIIGGFFSPFILKVENIESNQNIILAYVVLLNLGILAISSFKNWRALSFVGFLFTYFSFAVYFFSLYGPERLAHTELVLTIFFLLFAFITILYHFINKKRVEWPDLALIIMNAAIYFSWSYKLLAESYKEWMGFFTVILAISYFLLAYFAYLRNRQDPRLTLFLSGISLVFLTIAIPIQLKYYWITIAWAVEAVILSYLGFYLKSYHLRAFSLLVFVLVIIRLLVVDMTRGRIIEEFTPIFNERFFVFFIGILAFYLASYIWWLGRKEIKKEEEFALPFLLLSANFFTLWALSHEIINFFAQKINYLQKIITDLRKEVGVLPEVTKVKTEELRLELNNLRFIQNLSISLLWAAYSMFLSLIGIIKKYKPLQTAALTLIGLIMAKLIFFDVLGKSLTLGQNFSLSFIWAVYSIIIICMGIFMKNSHIRIFGLAFLWLIVFKVFLFDTWALAQLYRIASYISLGVILLVTGYLYLRFKKRIKDFLLEQ